MGVAVALAGMLLATIVPPWIALAVIALACVIPVVRTSRLAGTSWTPRTVRFASTWWATVFALVWAMWALGSWIGYTINARQLTHEVPHSTGTFVNLEVCDSCMGFRELLFGTAMAAIVGALLGCVLALPIGWVARRFRRRGTVHAVGPT